MDFTQYFRLEFKYLNISGAIFNTEIDMNRTWKYQLGKLEGYWKVLHKWV